MGCTWQPRCFIGLQQLLIRLQKGQAGPFHSRPEPPLVLLVRGGGGCCGLCWCQLELLEGEWCLSFSAYCRVFARGAANSSSWAGCAAEQSPLLRRGQCHTELIPIRAEQHTELPPSARRVSQGFCTRVGLGYRHLISLPPSQTTESPSSSASGA